MEPSRWKLLLGCLCACLTLMLGNTAAHAADAPAPVTVYAAASLKESLDTVAAQWKAKSGQEVRVSYAATSVLASQIEQGAPADLFIPADAQWMDHLQTAGLIDAASRRDLLGNRLVLIVPAASTQQPFGLRQSDSWIAALQGGRLSLAETASVPAGRYARQALQHLGVWDVLQPHLAQSDNVRIAMSFVALGEAPLGIVYATDARAETKVRVLADIAGTLHAPIVYPIARVRSADAARSRGLLDYLSGGEARPIFERAGFTMLPPAP